MPSKNDSQSRLFRMAYAVRKKKLKRSEVSQSVLDVADSDMTDKQLKDFFPVKGKEEESFQGLTPLSKYVQDIMEDSPYSSIGYASDSIALPASVLPEYVFTVIKPGFINLAQDIISMFEKAGFKAANFKTKRLLLKEAEKLYKAHKKEDFYPKLCKYMSSGTSMAVLYELPKGDDMKKALEKVSDIKDKIRDKWGKDDMRNVLHSSDSPENVWNEMAIYF